jgi:hypothetical protein
VDYQIEKTEMIGSSSKYGVRKCVEGNPEVKRQLGRLMCRWENDIKLNLQKME